ncbi:fpr1A [Symbiodinium sp. CCMP2592]|nr:fpr1A [Symbiodinium sp. CCMP2592]
MALRPVQASLLGGSVASLLFRAAEDFIPSVFEPPGSVPFVCPALDLPEGLHWPSLCIGVLSGSLRCGPGPDLCTGFCDCMSAPEPALLQLVVTVRDLATEVRRLSSELRALQVLVSERLGPVSPRHRQPRIPEGSPHPWNPTEVREGPLASPGPAQASPSATAASAPYVDPGPSGRGLTEEERRDIAKRVGQWFCRCLAGQHRGLSGREENPLANRVYLVLRDHSGRRYDPPLLARSFESIKKLVKPAGFVAEQAEEESPEVRPRELRFAYVGGEANFEYEVGALAVGDGDSRRTIAVILVVPFEGRTLAVFPQKAWDKKVSKRKLPSGPFSKPMLVEVVCASPTDRSVVGTEPAIKVWIGLLAASLADQVTFESGELPDISFATSSKAGLPFAEALVDLAETHFGFHSALSAAAGGDVYEQRFRALEASIARIAESVGKLAGSPEPGGRGALDDYPGVGDGDHAEGVGSLPPLSGGEDDLPDEASGAPAMERAVLALTNIMKQIVDKKKTGQPASTLDAALDQAENSAGSDLFGLGSGTGGRSKAAAYRLLRESLERSPELIYQEIERLMDEDLLSRRAVGSLSSAQSSARAWIEFRSRVGFFPTTIRVLWCLGGILDCLRDDRVAEARARTCLAIAAVDQQCIDAGGWVYAQEILFESPPPLGSFQGRKVLLDPLESYHTRLLSSRWSDVLLHRVKEMETFLEAKRKLGRGRGSEASVPKGGEEEVLPPGGRGGRRVPKNGALSAHFASGCSGPSFVNRAFFRSSLAEVGSRCADVARCNAKALHVTATVLDSLLASPFHRVCRGAVTSPFAGSPANVDAQVVRRCWRRLSDRLREWDLFPPVTRQDLGRAAGKVEKIEEQIGILQEDRGAAGPGLPNLALAQDVVASRISFTGVPEFDPCPYLDDQLRDLYVRPKDFSCKLDLLALLDSGERLALRPASQNTAQGCCGVFSVPKSASRDRLIIDARPGNAVQTGDNRWLVLMPTSAALLGIELEEAEVATFSGADIKEFYHNFLVSEQRASLYTFQGTFAPADLACLRSFEAKLLKCSRVAASLRTMAMGDINSVSFGQASHIGLMLAFGVIGPEKLLTLRGRFPRGDLALGIVIDDLVCIEKSLRSLGPRKAKGVMEKVHLAYKQAPLPVHQGKCFNDLHRASFWGSEVDGLCGWVRPSWSRVIPLVSLTIACIKLPVLSVSLLEVLAGSWIAVVSYRRRLMSLLNHIYLIQRGRSRKDVVRSTPGLRAELFALCALAPFVVCDMRACSSGLLVCTDASDLVGAGAVAEVGRVWGKELHRHALCKGLWNRLLRPSECLLRRAGALEAESELPGESFRTHALWSSLCRFLSFRVLGFFKRRGTSHINLKEAESYLAVEEHLAAGVWESSRTLALLDSQVVLGSLLKGRSSSPLLNVLLQGSVPAFIFFNVHPSYSFVASEDNPSDDPSRLRPIRSPTAPPTAFCPSSFKGYLNSSLLLQLAAEILCLLEPLVENTPGAKAKTNRRGALLFRVAVRMRVLLLPLAADVAAWTSAYAPDHPWDHAVPGQASLDTALARLVRSEHCKLEKTHIVSLFLDLRGFFDSVSYEHLLLQGLAHRFPPLHLWFALQVYQGLLRMIDQVQNIPALSFDWSYSESQDLSCPELQKQLFAAVASENQTLDFTCTFASFLADLRIPFWISGPASSHMWIYPSVLEVVGRFQPPYFWTFDRCRFSEPWQKRTRVLLTAGLAGVETYCLGGHSHQRLRGRGGASGPDWTKAAGEWPRGAALELARSLAAQCGSSSESADTSAFVGHLRIGEAKNPGPPKRVPRRGSLFDVELVEAATLRVRAEIWSVFVAWLREGLSEGAVLGIFRCPPLLALMLRDYGDVLYQTGFPLGAATRLPPHTSARSCHASHGWNGLQTWAATTLAMFYFICRPGEVLRGLRRDLLTPDDILEADHSWLYLRIRGPKTKRRGAKIQHVKLDDYIAMEIALLAWEGLPKGRPLYPGSPSAYRRRWDVLLRALAIPAAAGLTPASVRAGGAITAFQRGLAVPDLMWRMRLKSQVTLEHYLQEMAGFSVLPSLSNEARRKVKVAGCLFKAVEERAIHLRAARLAASSGVEVAAELCKREGRTTAEHDFIMLAEFGSTAKEVAPVERAAAEGTMVAEIPPATEEEVVPMSAGLPPFGLIQAPTLPAAAAAAGPCFIGGVPQVSRPMPTMMPGFGFLPPSMGPEALRSRPPMPQEPPPPPPPATGQLRTTLDDAVDRRRPVTPPKKAESKLVPKWSKGNAKGSAEEMPEPAIAATTSASDPENEEPAMAATTSASDPENEEPAIAATTAASDPQNDEEIVFVPKSFSEVQMPSNSLSFEQMPPSNSDGLLANRTFMRAVDAARAQAAQQKAEEAATRLPGGVKRQAQLCLSQLSMEKLYQGKIVIAFKLGLLVDINADVLGLLRWKHVKGVPRKLLKEGGNLANLRVEKVRGERFTLRLECIGLPGQTFEETEYPDIVARVYDWAIAPKLLDVSVSEEETTPTAAQKQRLGRMGPRNVGDGEGLAIRGPAPFNARRFLRPGKCGPRYSDQP